MAWSVSTDVFPQEVEKLFFAERFGRGTSASVVQQPVLPKAERLNSSLRGNIEMFMINDVPDSVRICAEVAAELWRSYLNNKYPIKIEVYYQDLDTDDDMQIEVAYQSSADTYYPTSLYSYLFDEELNADDTIPDAWIFVNKASTWDCSHNEAVSASTRSMTYAFMRAIAVALGFGSSVTQKTVHGENLIAFGESRGHSAFDHLIFSSTGEYLKDISNIENRENPALTNYVQPVKGTYLYALKQDDSHKLYAPENFEVYKSLVYLDNDESLMHYDLRTGNKQFRVDGTTIELLNAIGWGIDEPQDVEIVGEGIDSTGLASAYESHHFSLQNHLGGTVTDAKWLYVLPLSGVAGSEAREDTVAQGEGTLAFDIPAVADESRYDININGDISGQVIFTGKVNGKEVEDVFHLSLELKPKIKAVNIVKKENNSPFDSYNLYYTVEYVGSDYLYIEVEEEYGFEIRQQFVYEPFLAHVISDDIIAPFYNWVDIYACNKYGEDVYTIELPPYATTYAGDIPLYKPEVEERYAYIDVFDEGGRSVARIQSLEELRAWKRGLYILKFYKDGICVKTTKYLKP